MQMLKRRSECRHVHLGHVGYQMLQKISTKKPVDGIPVFKDIHHDVVCPGCQYGNSPRLSFPNSKNRASTMLHLAHSDVLEPTRTPSCTGYHYVMAIVDDFSRFTMVYSLKHKSEVFSKLIQFKQDAE